MVDEILTAAGILHKQDRFLKLPETTYAVYSDDESVDGADTLSYLPASPLPKIVTHNISVEIYEPKPDNAAEASLEEELSARGIHWTKQDRYWLQDLQRYQVVYEFEYITKGVY